MEQFLSILRKYVSLHALYYSHATGDFYEKKHGDKIIMAYATVVITFLLMPILLKIPYLFIMMSAWGIRLARKTNNPYSFSKKHDNTNRTHNHNTRRGYFGNVDRKDKTL